jgi:hypothetical protein
MSTLDTTAIANAAAAAIVDGLNGLIADANADVQGFAAAIARDTIEASAAGRLDLLDTLADQAKVLAEKSRLQFVAGAEATALKFVEAVLGMAVRLSIPPIPPITL